MHKLFSSFGSTPDANTTDAAAGADDAEDLRKELQRSQKNRETLLDAYGELQGRNVVLEASSKQLKEDYEALKLEHSELKAAYAKLEAKKNAANDAANETNEGVPVKGNEDAEDKADHRRHDDEDDEFELVDAVEEKLVPEDDPKLCGAEYTLNQTT